MDHQLPAGFKLAGVYAGIKQASQQNDLALFVADSDVVSSGMYTTNLVRSSSVIWNEQRTPADNCRAIVVNSGNSNACTGQRGETDTREMARLTADMLGAESDQVLVMSTGIIGQFLPMEKIESGIRAASALLGKDRSAIDNAAQAIITTDTSEKIASCSFKINDDEYQLLGFAKGAGMIGPNMATLLSVVLTDAPITKKQSADALRTAVDRSFNCVSVDGHMSTSDTCLMLSSGDPRKSASFDLKIFTQHLTELCIGLARQVANDGEGATHLVTINVAGCRTEDEAKIIGKTIANSALVKTAIAGNDPNWGRIVSAAGYAGVQFDPNGCSLSVNEVEVFRKGMPTQFDFAALSLSMKANRETKIDLSFSEGNESCRFWTCDLTAEYIHINADYHT